MEIIKPLRNEIIEIGGTDCLDIDDKFFDHSHCMYPDMGWEYTLCGIACEEWQYVKFKTVKKITCPECLKIIKYCKSYKL
jgi:hypothetical protein